MTTLDSKEARGKHLLLLLWLGTKSFSKVLLWLGAQGSSVSILRSLELHNWNSRPLH